MRGNTKGSDLLAYCLYLRKSRADAEAEARGEGETLARQEKLLLALARNRDRQYDVTEIYREIVSGDTIAARPVMQHLLEEVGQGKWEGVLVAEVERLARGNTIDQGIVAQTFACSGTKIITPLKVYDPDNEMDMEYFEFGLYMSRQEYRTINRRLQRGRIVSAREGKWVHSMAPYGYKRVRVTNDKGWTLEPVEEEADVVRYIFRLYTVGEQTRNGSIRRLGICPIARKLNELRIPPRSAPYWHMNTIKQILHNPVYIGKVRWNYQKQKKSFCNGKITTKRYFTSEQDLIFVNGRHPAIVEEATFSAAQDIMSRKGPTPVPLSKAVRNPLAGILICGKCGRRLVFQPDDHGGMLRCPNNYCDNVSARFFIVEERLLEALQRWLSDFRFEWSDTLPEDRQELSIRQKAVHKAQTELEMLRRQLSRTHDLLEQGVYDTDTFLARSRSVSERIRQVSDNLTALSARYEEEKARIANRKTVIPKVQKLLDVYYALPSAQAKNEMLKEILEKVEYTRLSRGGRNGPLDNFELVLFPKLPRCSKD